MNFNFPYIGKCCPNQIGNRQKIYMTAFFFFFFLDKPAQRDQNPKGQVNIWEKESKVLDNQPESASK